MWPTIFGDLVILALAVPCIVLVLAVYVLLTAALIVSMREKYLPATSGMSRHAQVES